jgi:tRNA threonylcarbamoyladenosine biosynthesis protein TsaE
MKTNFNKNKIPNISKKILKKVSEIKHHKAKILALSGDLGSGKTTLTQVIAKDLNIKQKIISPTFVIMKIYNINPNSIYHSFFKKLIHIDAYRLEKPDEILKINWLEIVEDKDNLIIVEWPEKIKKHIKGGFLWVKLEHINEQTRSIEF